MRRRMRCTHLSARGRRGGGASSFSNCTSFSTNSLHSFTFGRLNDHHSSTLLLPTLPQTNVLLRMYSHTLVACFYWCTVAAQSRPFFCSLYRPRGFSFFFFLKANERYFIANMTSLIQRGMGPGAFFNFFYAHEWRFHKQGLNPQPLDYLLVSHHHHLLF